MIDPAVRDDPAPLAIDGGAPSLDAPYPIAPPVEPADDDAPVEALERELADRLGVPAAHVVATGSTAYAYDALLLGALPAGGAPDGAEVIVPTLPGGDAPAVAAGRLGLVAVPADVDPATATLSARAVARAAGPRTALVVTTHAFGHPAPVDEIARLVDERGIAVAEDASEALGAALRGVPAGRMAEAAVVAFAPGRPLTGGGDDGALLVVRDAEHAAESHRRRADADAALDDATARVALAELRALDAALAARRSFAWELTLELRGAKGLVAMPHGRWIRHGYARYVVRLRSLVWRRSLDDTIAALRAEGVPCERAVGPPLHLDAAVRTPLADDERLSDDRFGAAAALAEELIAIPLHGGLTARDAYAVGRALRRVERWAL